MSLSLKIVEATLPKMLAHKWLGSRAGLVVLASGDRFGAEVNICLTAQIQSGSTDEALVCPRGSAVNKGAKRD